MGSFRKQLLAWLAKCPSDPVLGAAGLERLYFSDELSDVERFELRVFPEVERQRIESQIIEQRRRIREMLRSNSSHARARAMLSDVVGEGRPFGLFLRSFSSEVMVQSRVLQQSGVDNHKLAGISMFSMSVERPEEDLIQHAMAPHLPLIAIKNPCDLELIPRIPRLAVQSADWYVLMELLVRESSLIVFLYEHATAGVWHELRTIANAGKADQTFVLMAPGPRFTLLQEGGVVENDVETREGLREYGRVVTIDEIRERPEMLLERLQNREARESVVRMTPAEALQDLRLGWSTDAKKLQALVGFWALAYKVLGNLPDVISATQSALGFLPDVLCDESREIAAIHHLELFEAYRMLELNDEATRALDESERLLRECSGFGATFASGRLLFEKSALALVAGRWDDALAHAVSAERAFVAVDNPEGVAKCRRAQASILMLLGRIEEAFALEKAVIEDAEKRGDEQSRSLAELERARTLVLMGELDYAIATYVSAIDRLSDESEFEIKFESTKDFASTMLAMGATAEVRQRLRGLRESCERGRQGQLGVVIRLIEAMAAVLTGDLAEAHQTLIEAYDLLSGIFEAPEPLVRGPSTLLDKTSGVLHRDRIPPLLSLVLRMLFRFGWMEKHPEDAAKHLGRAMALCADSRCDMGVRYLGTLYAWVLLLIGQDASKLLVVIGTFAKAVGDAVHVDVLQRAAAASRSEAAALLHDFASNSGEDLSRGSLYELDLAIEAALRRSRGDLAGACEYVRRRSEALSSTMGDQHPFSIRATSELAAILHELGDEIGALGAEQHVWEGIRRLRPSGDDEVLRARHDIARTLRKLGRLEEAATELDALADTTIEEHGANHSRVAGALSDRADVASEIGDHALASRLYRRVAEIEVALGRCSNADIAAVWMLAASASRRAGQRAQCEAHLDAATDRIRLGIGPADAQTAALLVSFLQDETGSAGRAIKAQRAAIRGLEITGTARETVLGWKSRLSEMLKEAGSVEEAMSIDTKVLGEWRKLVGDHHRSTLIAINNLCVSLARLKQTDEAIDRIEAALVASAAAYGSKDSTTTKIAWTTFVIHANKKHERAREIFKEYLTWIRGEPVESLDAEHRSVRSAIDQLFASGGGASDRSP